MSKSKTVFLCQECGADYPKWTGRCAACGQWNSIVEDKRFADKAKTVGSRTTTKMRGTAGHPGPVPITAVQGLCEMRAVTGIEEFDRILGGGIVAGAVVLIGGEPGIGKSTLVLQVAHKLASKARPSLYVSGEESLEQMRLRATRMGVLNDDVLCLNETQVEFVADHVEKVKPSCVIVDSIQTAYTGESAGAPGSLSQIRDCANYLIHACKLHHVPLFLIGHVTKSGMVAGPRILEHMVDTVLYFEGDRHHNFRILRAVKNRFGSTNEIGIFEMVQDGLAEVKNPSRILLQERPEGAAGSVVVPVLEGTRPLLVEIQALTSPNGGFGAPRRSANGIDARRMALWIAVLEKRLGLKMYDHDVFVNIAGGIRVDEPAADLAALLALVSSHTGIAVPQDMVVIGEVGLAGEIRSVSQLERRLVEAGRLGFTRAVVPGFLGRRGHGEIKTIAALNVREAMESLGLIT